MIGWAGFCQQRKYQGRCKLYSELLQKYPSLKEIRKFPKSGQKQVYLVHIDDFGNVMLKVTDSMNERVQREIQIVTENDIPNVPKILKYETFQDGGDTKYYSLEEYIEGQTLTELLKENTLTFSDKVNLLETLLTIEVCLEKIKVVHRDIKPDNIICDTKGTFHLIDFGIARALDLTSLTMTGISMGPHTPGYGAPELFQYEKRKIDNRADLFSIGVVAYEAFLGKHPFKTGKEESLSEIWYETKTVMPQDYSISGDPEGMLMAFIQMLLQKQVSKRPASAQQAKNWFDTIKGTLEM